MNKIKTLSCCAILQVFILVCCGQSIDRSVMKDVKTLQSKPIQLCLDSSGEYMYQECHFTGYQYDSCYRPC